jgi:hypothetical protein
VDSAAIEVSEALLRRLGIAAASCRLTRLAGGRNNRVYRVDLAGRSDPLLLKCYFYSRDDRRDRLGAEWGFATFAWSHGVRSLPEPLACDRKARAALFRFVAGERPRPGSIGRSDVEQALALVRDVNRYRSEGANLPIASEACFSPTAHLAAVQRRIDRVIAADAAEHPLTAAVRAFAADEVKPVFATLARELRDRLGAAGIVADRDLPPQERCLSPSDFGFHNALRDADGVLRFLDFEYAGWDDPGKLVGDFFNQVAVPVPDDCYRLFGDGVIAALGLSAAEQLRFDLLRQLYAIKWTMIVLNEFCRSDRARRAYAARSIDDASLARQLALAREKIGTMQTATW